MAVNNWSFPSLTKNELNQQIDLELIGAVGNSGNQSISGDLSVSGVISGSVQGVGYCTTADGVAAKVVNVNIYTQSSILVNFKYANTEITSQNSKLTIVGSNNIPYDIYIGGELTSPTNCSISAGTHIISFAHRTYVDDNDDVINSYEAHLDYLLPNSPSALPTSLVSSSDTTSATLTLSGDNFNPVSGNLPVADATHSGIVTAGTQTIGGNKTFSGSTTFSDSMYGTSGTFQGNLICNGTISGTLDGVAYKIRTSAPSNPQNGDIWLE